MPFKGLAPLVAEAFRPFRASPPDPKAQAAKIYHVGGPLGTGHRKVDPSTLGKHSYEADIIAGWQPHMQLSPVNENTGRALSAAEVKRRMGGTGPLPMFFSNPMQDLDYLVIEAMTKNAFIGPLMNAFTRFIIGTGFRPELELIHGTGDAQADSEAVEAGRPIIDALREIDRQIDMPDPARQDISFIEKMAAVIDTTNTFNRSMLVFGYEEGRAIEVMGRRWPQIPTVLKFAHARDIGIINVSPESWKLEAVQWRNSAEMIPADSCIYLWNPLITAKYHNAWFYGGSMILPMLDAARGLRRIIGVDFPNMAEATWAGMPILIMKPQGQTKGDKEQEYGEIASRFVRGGPNILLEDPQNVSYQQVDFAPRVGEFIQLCEFLIRYCAANLGLPQSMFFDEAASNRATMLGKIQLALSTIINPLREQFGRQICLQWYQRWFELIFPDEAQTFRIKLVWDDLHIEEWIDKIQAVTALDARKPLTDKAFGELAGIPGYENKIDLEQVELQNDIMRADAQPPSPSRPKPKGGAK